MAALAQSAPINTSPFSCLTTADPACIADSSHHATALGLGVQGSSANGGANSINISAPTQNVNAQAATDSFNGHAVHVSGGSGGSFVALPVGGASNTGGGPGAI